MPEDIESLRKPPRCGVGGDLVPHVERMLLALGDFLRGKLAASRDRPVLRFEMDCHRVGWVGVCRVRCRSGVGRPNSTPVGNCGDKGFEILFLVLGKALIF